MTYKLNTRVVNEKAHISFIVLLIRTFSTKLEGWTNMVQSMKKILNLKGVK